jgi:hypothetical protein
VGLLLATGVSIVNAGGTRLWQLALVAGTVVVTIQGKPHPAGMIGGGAAVGLALGR